MTITTPPLRVSQERTLIVSGDGKSEHRWAHFTELRQFFPNIPVTKEFVIVLSTDHIPFGLEVNLNRRLGTLSHGTRAAYMKIGWNDFVNRNMVTSGTYWMAVQAVESASTLRHYRVPVRVEYDAEIAVMASTWDEAKALVEHRLLGQVTLQNPRPAARTHVRINYTEYEKQRKDEHPRIGAFYRCSSSSRPQIDGEIVELVEIKTARQVGVKDSFGDVYYTNPSNLTYHHG